MKKTISSRDLQLLSAYLDQQVNAGDRRKVETRLREDDEFRKSYEQLSRTRRLLRSVPVVRAPRNFTLSPSQVRAVPFQRLIPFFGVVSAAASFLLVLVFLSGIIFLNPRTASPAALQKESVPQVAMQSNPAENSTAEDNGIETATDSTLVQEAPAGASAVSPTETPPAPRLAAPLATQVEETYAMKAAPITATETVTATIGGPGPWKPACATYDKRGGTTSTPAATEPAPLTVQAPNPVPGSDSTARQQAALWIPWIEGTLLLLALAAGILYLILRRNLLRVN